MPVYSYTALDKDGSVFRFRSQALSRSVLKLGLLEEDLFLVRCQRVILPDCVSLLSSGNLELVYEFSLTLGMLIAADITLYQAMEVLQEDDDSRLVNLVVCIRRDIDRGHSFSEAASRHYQLFDPVYLAALKLAETTGDQNTALADIAASARWQLDFRTRIKRILIYPALVALLTLTVFVFLMIYVVPEIRSFVETVGQELPFHTQILFGISDFLFSNGFYLLFLVLVMIFIAILGYSKSYGFQYRVWRSIARLKLLGPLLVRSEISSFSQSMSVLSYAKNDLLTSLELSKSSVKSIIFEEALGVLAKRLESGVDLSVALAKDPLFPPEVAKIVLLGEQCGNLAGAFGNLRVIYERKIQETVNRLETVIGPFLILVLGGMVLWLVMSIVSPLYNVLSLPGVL